VHAAAAGAQEVANIVRRELGAGLNSMIDAAEASFSNQERGNR
jgi:hypothetical protein